MDKPTYTKEELDASLLTAERNLSDAVRAITDCLEYEFENEFMPEFEELNAAHLRWLTARHRIKHYKE